MSLAGHGESVPAHRPAGSTLNVDSDLAASLIADGVANLVGVVNAAGALVPARPEKPKAPLYVKKSLPSRYPGDQSLREAHEAQECINEIVATIEDRKRTPASHGSDAERHIEIDKLRMEEKAIRDRFEHAWYVAGNLVLEDETKYNARRDELEAVALEIFALRLTGLGLDRAHVMRIFPGSSAHAKYVKPRLTSSGRRSAGHGHFYLDAGLPEIASRLIRARSGYASMETLLSEAKAELAATTAAFAISKEKSAA